MSLLKSIILCLSLLPGAKESRVCVCLTLGLTFDHIKMIPSRQRTGALNADENVRTSAEKGDGYFRRKRRTAFHFFRQR